MDERRARAEEAGQRFAAGDGRKIPRPIFERQPRPEQAAASYTEEDGATVADWWQQEGRPLAPYAVSLVVIVALVLIGRSLLNSTPAPQDRSPAPVPTIATRPTRAPPAPAQDTGGSSVAPAAPDRPLPSCASVTDTRTACQQDAQPTAAPTVEPPTATPPYLARCETAPGARPCWLPADQVWQPPASVPATPLVLIVPTLPPLVSAPACLSWHPPQTLPAGCP